MKYQFVLLFLLILTCFDAKSSDKIKYKLLGHDVIRIDYFDNDEIKDTLILSKINNKFIPKEIIWGSDSLEKPQKSIFKYPNWFNKNFKFFILHINNDKAYDLVFLLKGEEEDQYKNIVKAKSSFVVFGQEALKKKKNINLNIKDSLQLKPFVAMSFEPGGLLERPAYRQSNGYLSYRIKKINFEVDSSESQEKYSNHIINAETTFNVYPNPTTSLINVEILNACNDCVYNYRILNLSSQLLINEQVNVTKSEIFKIDMSNLSSGCYFYQSIKMVTPSL
jgi:hypothetical protein